MTVSASEAKSVPGQSLGFEADLLGTVFRTTAEDPGLLAELERLLEIVRVVMPEDVTEVLHVSGEVGHPPWILQRNGRATFRTNSRRRLLEHYFSVLNELAIDNFQGLSIHAGVVADGRCALAIPGPSGAGKSTLTAACVAAGFAYASDEALCIDPRTSQIVPYPRPLMLSTTSRNLLGPPEGRRAPGPGKLAVSPLDLGGRTSAGPLRLAHVILPDRGAELALEPLAGSDIVPELLDRSFNRLDDPAGAFGIVSRAAEGCRAWRLGYRDALDAAALIRRALPFSRPAS